MEMAIHFNSYRLFSPFFPVWEYVKIIGWVPRSSLSPVPIETDKEPMVSSVS
jgi:hypothetical protein